MDEKLNSDDFFSTELETEELESHGFLGVATILFVIYAITSRPVLYDSIRTWIFQALHGVL